MPIVTVITTSRHLSLIIRPYKNQKRNGLPLVSGFLIFPVRKFRVFWILKSPKQDAGVISKTYRSIRTSCKLHSRVSVEGFTQSEADASLDDEVTAHRRIFNLTK